MAGFEALWGDDLTEDDVAECLEVETQASQVPVSSSVQPLPFRPRRIEFIHEPPNVTNVPMPGPSGVSSNTSKIPRLLPADQSRLSFRDDQQLRTSSSSSASSNSSTLMFSKLSDSQRKLKTPVRSLPEISQANFNKDKKQAATTEWLRKKLDEHKKNETEFLESKQKLEGEVKLLRERNNSLQLHFMKEREKVEQSFKEKEDKANLLIKQFKKESESSKLQLELKIKELEAKLERSLEQKNLSVVELAFPCTQTSRERAKNVAPTTSRTSTKQKNTDDDNDEDYFSNTVRKKHKRDPQADLKNFTCDELIKVMDSPQMKSPTKKHHQSSPTKQPSHQEFIEIDLTDSPMPPCQPDVRKLVPRRLETHVKKSTVIESRFPWLKPKSYSMSVHIGHLVHKEISDKLYKLSDPEIKIIVAPCIDFDPGNVLKMDCSDLQYLKDLEKGEKIWGVDLRTMYDTNKQSAVENAELLGNDSDARETVKTILGSQMCEQSPDQSRASESLMETNEHHNDQNVTPIDSNQQSIVEESMLFKNLEPIHIHMTALTKLQNWDSSLDLITPIVQHVSQMINDLFEKVCDPRIPDQLKDQFHNNEFTIGHLFMNGPYQHNDLLSHQKWTERERYVELRRGLAALSILCSLSKDTANLNLDSQLLNEVSKKNACIRKTINENSSNKCFLATNLKNRSHREITSGAEDLSSRFEECLNFEENRISKQSNNPIERISGSKSCMSSSSSPSSSSTNPSYKRFSNNAISIAKVGELFKIKRDNMDAHRGQEDDHNSTGSTSTVNEEEIMDLEADEAPKPSSRPLDDFDNDSYKAWYEMYTSNKSKLTYDERLSGSQKYRKLLDPQFSERERKGVSLYLKRRKVSKDFQKVICEKVGVWIPEKNDEDGEVNRDLKDVKNLYDYESEISNMNSTITSFELANMKPVSLHNDDPVGDIGINVRSQEGSPIDNEWRVNSLQKNEEDPDLTKEKPTPKAANESTWSFFEKFKTSLTDTTNQGKDAINVESRSKPSTSKLRKHSLAPLRKKGGKEATPPPDSLSNINKEMEMEVEMLFGKSTGNKKPNNDKEDFIFNEMAPFAPEHRFREAICDEDPRPDLLAEHLNTIPALDDPDFVHRFRNLYTQTETIAGKFGYKLKPFKKLSVISYLEDKEAREKNIRKEEKKKGNKLSNVPRGDIGPGPSNTRNQDDSDAIISMLNDEALKYSLNKNIKSFDKKRGNLNILEGILETVSSLNYCRLTLVFYPLMSSCVSLAESLFRQSYNNEHFTRESFTLIMKILNEITCCQPPPDIIEKILVVLMYAVKFPDIVECLCKKRSKLVSLVTKTDFCFFKGVCMMQPLCYLIGSLSMTSYPRYWSLSFAFTQWLRQLYDKYRLNMEEWYSSSEVCNCVPVLHNAIFSTISRAAVYFHNQAADCQVDETVRKTIEDIVRDGIHLCVILIEVDSSFINHLDKFHLYNEFLCTVERMHYDPHFSPAFSLTSNELQIVECLINANRLAKKRNPEDRKHKIPKYEETKKNFNIVSRDYNCFL